MEDERNAYERHVVKMSCRVQFAQVDSEIITGNRTFVVSWARSGMNSRLMTAVFAAAKPTARIKKEDDHPFNGYRKDHMPASS